MKPNAGKMVAPKMKTKRVWLSCYFNYYNAIVIFNKKPFLTKAGTGRDNTVRVDYYDMIHPKNKHIIAGVSFLDDFKELFPTVNISTLIQKNGNVITREPEILVEATLTAPFDIDGKLRNIDFSLDGYQDQR
jgi:hypothetical protein